MIKNFTKFALLCIAALTAVSASAQTYSGVIDESDYVQGEWQPGITYSITYNTDKTLTLVCEFAEDKTGLVPQINWKSDGAYTALSRVEGLKYTTTTTETFESGTTINSFFWLAYAGGVSRANLTYTVGSSSGDTPGADTEAPQWTSDPSLSSVTHKSAEITLAATDDSGTATVTITGDNGFVETTATITADGTEQTITLNELSAETTYNLSFALSDATGNKTTETKTLEVTTDEAPALTELYIRQIFGADDWNVRGEGNTFAPIGNVLITITNENKVKFTISFVDNNVNSQVADAVIIIDGIGQIPLAKNAKGQWESSVTEQAIDRTKEYSYYGYFVINGVGLTSTLFDTAHSKFIPQDGSTSGVQTVESSQAKVIAGTGAIRVSGARSIAVYSVTGQLVYRAQATEAEIALSRGVYVVVVDGRATKVML